MTLSADDPRHGTSNGYTGHGCRCDPCRAAHTAKQLAWFASNRAKGGLPKDDKRHGSIYGYVAFGCHCKSCKVAWRDYCRERNHRVGRNRPMAEYLAEVRETPPPHGTETRYTSRYWRCRCAACREASRLARAARRAKAAT